MQANRLFLPIIVIILFTTLFAGLVSVSATAQTSTSPLAAKGTVDIVNAQASQKKHVIFRDDDIEPLSSNLGTLQAVNQVHINKNVPVTLAIIPHPDTAKYGNELLMDNPLLAYLRSKATNPLFEFAQHGYNHQINGVGAPLVSGRLYPTSSATTGEPSAYWRPSPDRLVGANLVGTSEFAGRPYADQYNAIKQGWDDMAEALGAKPTTFVPPWDVGDVNTLMAAHAVGHTLYSTGKDDLSGVSVPGITVQAASLELPWYETDWNTYMSGLISQTDAALNAAPGDASIVVLYHFWTFERSDGSVDPIRIAWLGQYIDHLRNRGDVDFARLDNQPGRYAKTQVSLAASNPAPAFGQSYTLSGYLKDSSAGRPVANKPIDIWVRHDGDNGKLWKTITTDSNGKYSTTASSTKKAYIRTVFKGDTSYAGSRSNLLTVTPRLGTTLTLTASTTTPLVGESYTLSGYLKDSTGRALANKPIDIWYRHAGETTGHLWKTVYTGTDGTYSTPAISTKTVYLRTVFKGDTSYAGSRSNLLTVTPRKMSTGITLTASTTTPLVGESYTLSGYLKDSTGRALANKPIDIWYRHAGETTGHLWKTVYTGTDGTYNTPVVSSQTVYLRTVFKGDSAYERAYSDLVTVSVH